ncbi:MAG: T9SS type A sorting domain-containing protein [Flavobacteriia bacterium]|nr:T9SS type A sorting domain-containing protein [Flavobacteriia bacterium]
MKNKNLYLLVMAIFFAIGIQSAFGQNPFWNSDVNVKPESGKYYKNVRTAVAYDGTVYLGRLSADSPAGPYIRWEVFKSADGGKTWNDFLSGTVGSSDYTAFDMITAGENASDFRLYVARAYVNDTETKLRASKYTADGTSTNLSFDNFLETPFSSSRGFVSLSWATDSRKPNYVSSPYSISLAASVSTPGIDRVICWTTNIPSGSFFEKELYSTFNFVGDVDATIGVDDYKSDFGRLGVVFMIKSNEGDENGKLYTRFVYPDNGDETSSPGPYQVGDDDYIYSSPTIAMSQVISVGSGPGIDDIRTLVAYSKQTGSGNKDVVFSYSDDMIGNEPSFTALTTIDGDSGDQMNPHMIFDPLFNNFLLTYNKASAKTLPYMLKGLNSTLAETFYVFKSNYRDATSNPASPIQPRVEMNNSKSNAVFAWNDDYLSMFDAEYSLGVSDTELSSLMVYPNPTKGLLNISSDKEISSVEFINMVGQTVKKDTQITNGKTDISSLTQGTYVMKIVYKNGSSERTKIIKK